MFEPYAYKVEKEMYKNIKEKNLTKEDFIKDNKINRLGALLYEDIKKEYNDFSFSQYLAWTYDSIMEFTSFYED
ncbi:MAG: hypothetical protein J6T10_24810 [Methanobrevibacter sp.]|nr:hypothetical protein [Methanobrevibacter sp.]